MIRKILDLYSRCLLVEVKMKKENMKGKQALSVY